MRRPRGDDGNAMVEFTWLAVLLMVPLVYLMLTVFDVQRNAYAAEAATREAGRAYVTSDDGDDPHARAVAAARLAGEDQGVTFDAHEVVVDCTQPCLDPGREVRVTITKQVPLPFVPRELFGRVPASIRVEAVHVEVVDEYRDPQLTGGRAP